MRIYISVDMEGITGLVDADDVQPGGRDYERGRLMMAEDINAAIRGAVAAGATDITVNDAHGPMRNLLPEALHPAARLIRGKPKQMLMLEGLAPEHDAAVFVGYHSRAGALGVLSHSFMGHEIEDMWLDGRPVGEIGLAHATAAVIGVPVTVLTGDDCACTEMTEWDASVRTVAVKYARDRFSADLRPSEEARAAIEKAVAASHSRSSATDGCERDAPIIGGMPKARHRTGIQLAVCPTDSTRGCPHASCPYSGCLVRRDRCSHARKRGIRQRGSLDLPTTVLGRGRAGYADRARARHLRRRDVRRHRGARASLSPFDSTVIASPRRLFGGAALLRSW